MKIIQSILNKLIESPNDILEVTNRHIMEVDEFEPLMQATNIVTGLVLTCEDHPNSDHLHKTTVDVGTEVLNIVCGAPNVAKGQYVIVAKVGAVLGEDFVIKAAKVRGEESHGMICSLSEIGIPKKHIPEQYQSGIYVFDEPQELGVDALKVLGLEGYQMTLGMTPNRADLLSHVGFAKDLSAVTNNEFKLPKVEINETIKNPFTIEIESEDCYLYHSRYFENIEIKESPLWLKQALIASDIEPINNVVDITNYVLLMYGTPLHAFDSEKLSGNKIIVKNAKEDIELVTLDEKTRKISTGALLINDAEKPVAVAGVMGLANTMITDATTKVLLEAAAFLPSSVAKTSKALDLKSDSSLRFERGIDQSMSIEGLNYATKLLVELANAKVSNVVSSYGAKIEQTEIKVAKNIFADKLGIELTEEALLDIFKRFRYEVKVLDNAYALTIPLNRKDLKIPADIVEEVARFYGLDLINNKPLVVSTQGKLSNKQKMIRSIRQKLAYEGFNEIVSYSLIAQSELEQLNRIGEEIRIMNPLSKDREVLRQSLLNGLLKVQGYNQKRMQSNIALFEIGHVYAKGIEKNHLAITMSNTFIQNKWQNVKIESNYFVLKGIAENLLDSLNLLYEFKTTENLEFLHPFIKAEILVNNKVVGYIGKLHPLQTKTLEIDETFVLEIDLDEIGNKEVNYQAISKYPSIERDIAFVIEDSITNNECMKLITQTARKQLTSVELFDEYKGANIKEGYKSLAYRLVFNDSTKTLEGNEVDKLVDKILKRLAFEYKVEIRN